MQLAHAVATLAGHGVPYRRGWSWRARVSVRRGAGCCPNPPGAIVDPQAVRVGSDQRGHARGDHRWHRQGLNDGFPYPIAGKSGTAERFSRTSDAYDTNKNNAYLASRHRAWFMGYAPADNPQIAAAVVLEAGAWGGKDAGPIMRKILDAWLATHDGGDSGQSAPADQRDRGGATVASAGRDSPGQRRRPRHGSRRPAGTGIQRSIAMIATMYARGRRFLRRIMTRPRIDLPLAVGLFVLAVDRSDHALQCR